MTSYSYLVNHCNGVLIKTVNRQQISPSMFRKYMSSVPNQLRGYSTLKFVPLVSTPKCFVAHFPNYISMSYSSDLFEILSKNIPWRNEEDSYGLQSRLTHYVGDDEAVFHYVGLTLDPKPWPEVVKPVKTKLENEVLPILRSHLNIDRVDNISEQNGSKSTHESITGCLMNNFKENSGSIPWHSDEVRAHGNLKCVISLSLGGPRWFELRHKRQMATKEGDDDDEVIRVLMESGSLIVMAGETQEHFEHSLPLQDDDDAKARISLTFRTIVKGFETNLIS